MKNRITPGIEGVRENTGGRETSISKIMEAMFGRLHCSLMLNMSLAYLGKVARVAKRDAE